MDDKKTITGAALLPLSSVRIFEKTTSFLWRHSSGPSVHLILPWSIFAVSNTEYNPLVCPIASKSSLSTSSRSRAVTSSVTHLQRWNETKAITAAEAPGDSSRARTTVPVGSQSCLLPRVNVHTLRCSYPWRFQRSCSLSFCFVRWRQQPFPLPISLVTATNSGHSICSMAELCWAIHHYMQDAVFKERFCRRKGSVAARVPLLRLGCWCSCQSWSIPSAPKTSPLLEQLM